jgi:ferredoxin
MTEVKEKKLVDIRKEADEIKCPVRQALYLVEEFLAGPMCGKCFPCEMGTFESRIRLVNLISGQGTDEDIDALRRIADEMTVTSRCKKGKDASKFMLEWLSTDVFAEHVAKNCPAGECTTLQEYRIIPDNCIMCGECLDVCKDNAVLGEKKISYKSGDLPFSINQKRCTRCGECVKICPTAAIEVISLKDLASEEIKV